MLPSIQLAVQVLVLLCTGTYASEVSKFLKLGDTAFGNSEYNAAIRHYSSALDLDSNSALLYTKRAAAYISLRQQSQALRDLNNALELDNNNVQGYVTRGRLHRSMCNIDAADKDFKQVLETRPDHKTAKKELEILAQVKHTLDWLNYYVAQGQTEDAKNMVHSIYQHAEDCTPAKLAEARLYMEEHDLEQVVAATGRLLKSTPGNIDALVLRGQAYFYLLEHDMAKRHFGEVLKYDPDHKEAKKLFKKVKDFDRKRQQADNALEGRDWQEAANLYSEALQLDPDHTRANIGLWTGLAQARVKLRQHEPAVEAWEAVLTLSPGDTDAQEGKIRALIALERYQEALNEAREALQHNRGHHAFHQLYQQAEKLQKMADRKDYYKILGVSRDATLSEIKKAYRKLAMEHHPDKVPEPEKKAAEKRFHDIGEAYEVLKDDDKRTRYDNGEDLDDQGGGHDGFHPFHQHFHQGGGGGYQQTFHFTWG